MSPPARRPLSWPSPATLSSPDGQSAPTAGPPCRRRERGLLQRLSVIIPNYNYGRFLRSAITSALSVRWSDVEVIVVDDGSSDDSVKVARAFGSRITLLQQANAGPRVACNRGFAASSGDWVVFLDSDDRILPGAADAIVGHERPGISKVQFPMQRINASGEQVGSPFPRYRTAPDGATVRHWMRATASYPTPPGSGNIYSRWFLEQLFPLSDECGDASDSMCLAAAPLLGDVVTDRRAMFQYRVHGRNRSYLLGDFGRFRTQIERALQRHRFAQRLDHRDGDPYWLEPLFRARHLLQLRISHRRLTGEASPIPGDTFWRMARDCMHAMASPGPETIAQRFTISLWCVAALVAPKAIARTMIRARFKQPG